MKSSLNVNTMDVIKGLIQRIYYYFIHSSENPSKYSFNECHQTTSDKLELKKHMNRYSCIKRHKCYNECHKSFVKLHELNLI